MLDGRTVFFWVNLTAIVETKGEVRKSFPINYRIRVCGNEVLSRVNNPMLFNPILDKHVMELPIRQVRSENYWYYAEDYFSSNDPYCPILTYTISKVDGSPLSDQDNNNH